MVFLATVILLSSYVGLAKATSPGPVILLTGLSSVTAGVAQTKTIYLNISGGYVDSSHPYTVTWFEGKSNATSVQALIRHVIPNSLCGSYRNNCTHTTSTSLSLSYDWPGSYMVSVTVNDTHNDYSIAVDRVTVSSSLTLNCIHESGSNGAPYVGSPVLFSALSYPYPDVDYLWDFGDGSQAVAQWLPEAGSPSDCQTTGFGTHGLYGVYHNFSAPGDYVVKVTASDSFGDASRAFIEPLILADPQPALYNWSIPTKGFKSSPVEFWANATDLNPHDLASNVTFAWSFSDGSSWQISHVTKLSRPKGWTNQLATTDTSHVFTSTGNFTVWLEVFNQYWNVTANPTQTDGPSSVRGSISVGNPTAVSCYGGAPLTSVAVIGIAKCWGISPFSTAYNATWLIPGSKSFGLVGHLRSYTYGNAQHVPVFLNLSWGGGRIGVDTALVNFTDVAPIVGATSLTVLPTITFSITSTGGALVAGSGCIFSTIVVSLYNGSRIVSQATLGCGQQSVILPPVPLFLGNAYSLDAAYNAIGTSGTTVAQLSYSFAGNSSAPKQYSYSFVNSNPLSYNWTQDVDQISLGEPITVGTTIFSFADVSLTTTWYYGDGTSTQTTSPAPSQLGPTRIVLFTTHTWKTGSVYPLSIQTTDPVIGGQGGLTGSDSLTVIDAGDLSVSDTAPQAEISAPLKTAEVAGTPLSATVLEADGGVGVSSVQWYFGDGTTSSGASTTHNFSVSGSYPIVVVAVSVHGSISANFVLLRVVPAPVVPAINCTPTAPRTYVLVTCSAANSSVGSNGLSSAGIGWSFGDGTSLGGPSGLVSLAQHMYTRTGHETVNLTVQSSDGVLVGGTLTLSLCALDVTLLAAPPPGEADERYAATPSTTGCPAYFGLLTGIGYFQNISWNWGGGWPNGGGYTGSANKYGYFDGSTYVIPGTYTAAATVTNVLSGNHSSPSQRVTVSDYPVRPVLPYIDSWVTGENHSTNFSGAAIGGYYDSIGGAANHKWNFTWVWGDGTQPTVQTGVGDPTYAVHWYLTTGTELLYLYATSPEPIAYQRTGWITAPIHTVLDSDGDGLPNAFETLVTNTSPYLADTADKTHSYGVGLTDFQAGMLNGLLSNLSADQDGDGLSSIQEILGSVTGYPSNPLDANTSGDGIPDGGHFFTDSFRAADVVNLPSGAHITKVDIPAAGYGGEPIAFNQSKLTVELDTSTLANIRLNAVLADGANVSLPDPTNVTNTYYLLNSTPIGGPTGSISLQDLSDVGNWTIEVNTTSTFSGGSVPAVYLQDSYYTNPSLADPYHQGMLEGNSVTTPVFNCSAPSNETYPVFNATALTIVQQPFWPYTEQYYKLSLVQGIPYVAASNASATPFDNSSTCGSHVSSGHYHDVASYLGDADFGVNPWNIHAAGDPALTNGMKALGAASYNASEWEYENTLGQMLRLGGSDPYASDTIQFAGSLNPTASSSATDGVRDSQTSTPIQPLVLGVSVHSATDPSCITSWGPFGDVVSASVVGQQGPTVYTPVVDGTGGSSSSKCWSPYATGIQFSFSDNYSLPLNSSITNFSVEFALYHDDAVGYQTDGSTLTLTGPMVPFRVVSSPRGYFLNVSAEVLPMNRVNTILVNTTEELTNLSGYGLRYTGEQEFYAFYVNLLVPSHPFVAGTNLILESRKAFLASPAAAILENATTEFAGSKLACLGNAVVTSRATNSSPSQTGIAGTFSVDLTFNTTCATTLLAELSARNGSGVVIGENRTLSTGQISLLGLDTQVIQLAAYQLPTGYNSVEGPPPTGFLNSFLESSVDFFIGALVAVANFLSQLPGDVVSLGQLILGAIAKVLSTIAAAAEAALAAIESLLNFVGALAKYLLGLLVQPIELLLGGYVSTLWSSVNSVLATFNLTGTLTAAQEALVLSGLLGNLILAALVMVAGISIVIGVIEVFTLGADFIVDLLIGLLLTAAMSGAEYGFSLAGLSLPTSFFSSTTVSAVEAIYGSGTKLGPGKLPGISSCSAFNFAAYVFGDVGAGYGTFRALKTMQGLIPSWGSTYLNPFVALFVGLIGVFLSTFEFFFGYNSWVSVFALIFAGAGGMLTALQILSRGFSVYNGPYLSTLERADVLVNGAGIGLGMYDLKKTC